MDLHQETNIPGVWCIVAHVTTQPTSPAERRLGLDTFDPGAKVYLFPPVRPDGDPEVKAIGYRRRGRRLVASTVFVKHLDQWEAEFVTRKDIMAVISPPWDQDAESKVVAHAIAAWRGGGPWPMLSLRDWNRGRVQRTIGSGPWHQRMLSAIKSLMPKAGDRG